MNIKTHLGTICIGALAGSLTACPGPEPEAFDCEAQEEAFQASYADDGVLLPEIPDSASFPMALQDIRDDARLIEVSDAVRHRTEAQSVRDAAAATLRDLPDLD